MLPSFLILQCHVMVVCCTYHTLCCPALSRLSVVASVTVWTTVPSCLLMSASRSHATRPASASGLGAPSKQQQQHRCVLLSLFGHNRLRAIPTHCPLFISLPRCKCFKHSASGSGAPSNQQQQHRLRKLSLCLPQSYGTHWHSRRHALSVHKQAPRYSVLRLLYCVFTGAAAGHGHLLPGLGCFPAWH